MPPLDPSSPATSCANPSDIVKTRPRIWGYRPDIARFTGAKASISAIALRPEPSCTATDAQSRSGRKDTAVGPGGVAGRRYPCPRRGGHRVGSSLFQLRFSVPTRETSKSLDRANGLRVRSHTVSPLGHDRHFRRNTALSAATLTVPPEGSPGGPWSTTAPHTSDVWRCDHDPRAAAAEGTKVHYSAQRHPNRVSLSSSALSRSSTRVTVN